MLIRTIDRSTGIGPYSFVVQTTTETVVVRAPSASAAAMWSLAMRHDPRCEGWHVSDVFGPEVVRYYPDGKEA